MAIFRDRFPSKRDTFLVLASCVVPVYSWSMLMFFRRVQGWLLFLKPWDLIGVFAYAQIFAFLESIVLLSIVIFLSMILPVRLFRQRFVAQGGVMVLLTAMSAVVLQYKPSIASSLETSLAGVALYLVLNGLVYVLIRRYRRLEESIRTLAERLMVLLYLYMVVTCLSIMIVLFRNI